jgi:predicted RNA-binding Zn ribbon-like protein
VSLCLDFVNTLGDRPRRLHETLHGYDDLLRWSARAGLLDARALRRRRREAARRPRGARAAFAHAIQLRETLYRVFAARARRARPAPADLAVLNEALRRALPHQRLAPRGDGLEWRWEGSGGMEFPLWPVARSAAELLTSGEVSLVQECASDACSWLFLDRSPGGRRRWCDMKVCGNRAKARRFYERRRKGGRAKPVQ